MFLVLPPNPIVAVLYGVPRLLLSITRAIVLRAYKIRRLSAVLGLVMSTFNTLGINIIFTTIVYITDIVNISILDFGLKVINENIYYNFNYYRKPALDYTLKRT